MKVNFDNPWLLLAAIPALAAVIIPFWFYNRKRRAGSRKIAAFIARILAVVLLVTSLSGLAVSKVTDKNSILIVADLSDSARTVRDNFEEIVKTATGYSDEKTSIGLLTFGYNSEIELPPTEVFDFTVFETSPVGSYTDIYSAVIKAAALLPEDTNNRIILLTDGKENINSVREAANVLKSRNIRIDAIVNETDPVNREIQISDISIPEVVYSGEEFSITVTIESNVDCQASLTLTEDGVSSSENEISLTKGTNRFVFKRTAESTGISSYTAEVRAEGDWLAANNKIYSFINVQGVPKVLIIDGTDSESHEIEKILSGSVTVEKCTAAMAPATISELRKYEAVIMMNVTKDSLPEGFDNLLKSYVSQLGRGLLYTGGAQSYILGDWVDSTLEEILPVSMTIKDEYNLNDVGLMILIDNSGSMIGTPLELAKKGAIKAVSTVKPQDKVGVIAFSDNAVWISKMVPGTEKSSVQNKIETIQINGGTMLASSLNEAYEALQNCGTALKNVILLTDGQPADENLIFNSGIVSKMKEAQITVTSIAVGFDTSPTILNYISGTTGGNIINVQDESKLPQIIYTEALKAIAGSYLNNRTFYPEVEYRSNILSGIQALPTFDGYVKTEEKSLANTVLVTDEDDPLLAEWQYGLGRVVAYTSDLNGKWSSKLLASDEGVKLIKNMISFILPSTDTEEGGALSITRSGDTGIILFAADESGADMKTEATVISPSGKQQTIAMAPSGISSYECSFKLTEEGSYVAIVTQKDANGNTTVSKEGAMSVRYSDEYDMFAKDLGYVKALCEEVGGSADFDNLDDIMKIKITGADSRTSLATAFLIIAIILIMLDIALRRLGIDFAAIIAKIREKLPKRLPKSAPVTAPTTVSTATQSEEPVENKNAKEKTESFPEEKIGKPKKEKAAKKAEPEPKTNAQSSLNSISSLLKDVDNSKRRKM